MTLRIKLTHLVIGIVAGAVLAGGGYALATTRSAVIHACVNKRTRAVSVPVKGRCARGLSALSWNRRGPRGATGSRGPAGAAGVPATVRIGSVTTEPAGSQASVTNSGSGGNAVLNFAIPQGAAGQNGASATNTGPTAYGEVWMGSDVNSAQLAIGSNSANVQEVGGGNGVAAVGVKGCSSQGVADPVINLTANADAADHLTDSNSAGTAAAYVTGWSTSGGLLIFDVSTYDPIHGTAANSDFSFTVYC